MGLKLKVSWAHAYDLQVLLSTERKRESKTKEIFLVGPFSRFVRSWRLYNLDTEVCYYVKALLVGWGCRYYSITLNSIVKRNLQIFHA